MSSSCWPDHDEGEDIVLDDVSRMSATRVERVVMPLCREDVFEALEWAHARGLSVAARGTKHSMGGHSLAAGGVALDMAYVRHVRYDAVTQSCHCGAGALWADVICELNRHGKAPRTLQSYCFPEGEMQVLTNRGFCFLRDLLGKHYNAETLELRRDSDLLIASFDADADAMRYERCERLVLNPACEQELIEFTQRNDNVKWGREAVEEEGIEKMTSNHVSLLVTPDHNMWGRRGRYVKDHRYGSWGWQPFQRGGHEGEPKTVRREMEIFKAGDLVLDRVADNRLAFQFRAFAEEGFIGEDERFGDERFGDYYKLLEIDTEEKDTAFLKLYGYWIGDGSLSFAPPCGGVDAVLFSPVKKHDCVFLEKLFAKLGLVIGSDVRKCCRNTPLTLKQIQEMRRSLEEQDSEQEEVEAAVEGSSSVVTDYLIVKEAWWRYFRSHYQRKYKSFATARVQVPDSPHANVPTLGIKSAKWLLYWVFRRNRAAAAAILEGLRFADGSETADQNFIYTSSLVMVDDVMRLGLQAGFSVSASMTGPRGSINGADRGKSIIARHDLWRVSYVNMRGGEPTIDCHRDVHRVKYNGRTWCVTVPSGKIFVRRARLGGDGTISGFSRPVVVGNCSFSVGGSVSVNAHGITSDEALGESVLSAMVLRLDGEGRHEAIEAKRGSPLLGCVVGGFGLFGVLWEVEVAVTDNRTVALEVMHLAPPDFPHVYAGVLREEAVAMKLARIDITNFEHVALYVFRSEAAQGSVSDLPSAPRELSVASRLAYKWLAGPLLEMRFQAERALGLALDWAPVATVNQLLFESATPLAQLYSPLLAFDDTFILQEFFVPAAHFSGFFESLREAVGTMRAADALLLTLLNVTVRYVRRDFVALLPYAAADSFAFVLYYRLRRTPEAEARLRHWHGVLAASAADFGGTFYLPYRFHYSHEELRRCYPALDEFVRQKRLHDPWGLFANTWWDWITGAKQESRAVLSPAVVPRVPPPRPLDEEALLRVSLHRTDSFRAMLDDSAQRRQFAEDFLVHTFANVGPKVLMGHLHAACYDPRNKCDDDIYLALQAKLGGAGPMGKFFFLLKSVQQLAAQRAELVREVTSVVARLGLGGQLHDMLSVGDNGKLVLALKKALVMKGQFWVAHDCEAPPSDVAAVLERLSVEPVGTFARLDYAALREREFPGVPDGAADLVTMMQGLHHLPPAALPRFLRSVHRVLRPGGLFLMREHDMRDERLRPLLDCAHMVFNAVTGVAPAMERAETRGFRSLLEWRRIVEACGLVDVQLYEMQPQDCTVDVMMAFRKPGELPPGRALAMSALPVPESTAASKVAAALPKMAVATGLGLVNSLIATLPKIREFVVNTVKLLAPSLPGVSAALSVQIEKAVDGYLEMLSRFQPLTEAAAPAASGGPSMVPEEVFLLVPVLRIRARQGGLVESVLVEIIDRVEEALNPPPPPPRAELREAAARVSPAAFDAELQGLLARQPALRDVHAVVARCEAPPKAVEIMQGLLTEENLTKLRAKLLADLDPASWQLLQESLRRAEGQPTLARVLDPADAWHGAACAVLGLVELTWAQQLGLSSVGLSAGVALWKSAVELKRKRDLRDPAQLDPEAQAEMAAAMDALAQSRTVTVRPGKGLEDIPHVLVVEKAVLHAHSITRLLSDVETDVTELVAAVHAGGSGVLQLSELRLPATWRAGSHTLTVTYRPACEPVTAEAAERVATALGRARLVDTHWRRGNNLFTWLKLPEWMQAELVVLFGASMDHTPFYRFPFMPALEVFIRVLAEETRLCAAKFGWAKTLLSDAFVTDLVGAVIIMLGFGALNLAAKPILLVTGTEYPQETLIERLLVTAPRRTKWPASVREAREVARGVWELTVGTFKSFTAALQELAALPACTLLLASNNSLLQVRIGSLPDARLPELAARFGCRPATRFTYPAVGGVPNAPQTCLQVETRHLLDVLRFCHELGLPVIVYDLFNYD